MYWTEPKYSATRRLQELAFPAASIVLAFISFTGIAALSKFVVGDWALGLSVIAATAIGLVNYIVNRWCLSKRQEIAIDDAGVSIKGNTHHHLTYDEMRGFSIIRGEAGELVRHLVIYPETDGFFSIGVPSEISDEEIFEALPRNLNFVTYIDEQAMRNPHS